MRILILMMLSASCFADQVGCYQFGNITQCSNGVSAYQFGNITQVVTPYQSRVQPQLQAIQPQISTQPNYNPPVLVPLAPIQPLQPLQ